MLDIQLDSVTLDLALNGTDLVLIVAEDETIQHIRQRLLTFQGEWFLDQSTGVPWMQEILGKPQHINTVEAILKDTIQGSPGVVQLMAFSINATEGEREIRVDFSVALSSGAATTQSVEFRL
jgi:hypothetical protein